MGDFNSSRTSDGGVTVIRKASAGANYDNTTARIGPVLQMGQDAMQANKAAHPAQATPTYEQKQTLKPGSGPVK